MKHRKIRQFRSRQGKSDRKYKDSMKISLFCFVVIFILIIITLIQQ